LRIAVLRFAPVLKTVSIGSGQGLLNFPKQPTKI